TDFDALDSDASALAEQAYCMKDHDPGGQREGLLYQDPDGVPPENGCKFYREIRVTPVSEEGKDKSMEVESKVGWFHSGKFRTVILKTDIRNNVY
ncbi:hypothetical protein KKG51_03655, partial [Patescibacteria group bacterium]|nr:hypothetical protein [Patescibacteria group bacterium]